MLLTDKISIKDVMLFPAMKPENWNPEMGGAGKAGEACQVTFSSLQEKMVPEMIAAFANNGQVKFNQVADSKSDLGLPFVTTASGDVISTPSGIMSYLGRDAGLYGKGAF